MAGWGGAVICDVCEAYVASSVMAGIARQARIGIGAGTFINGSVASHARAAMYQ